MESAPNGALYLRRSLRVAASGGAAEEAGERAGERSAADASLRGAISCVALRVRAAPAVHSARVSTAQPRAAPARVSCTQSMLPNQNYVALFHGDQNIGWWPSNRVRGRTRFQPWRTCTFDEPYRRRLAQSYNVGEKVARRPHVSRRKKCGARGRG